MGSSAIEGVPATGAGGGAVSSVNTRTGAVVLTAADVGAGQLPAGVLLDSGIIIPSGADISGILGTSGSKAAAGNDARLSDARTPTAHKTSHEPGGSDALTLLDNSSIKAAAGIVLSKLAVDPLTRANHTGTQTMSTISDAGALATKSAVASADITDGTIVGGDLNSTIALPNGATATSQAALDRSTKVATNLYADRAVEAMVNGLGWSAPTGAVAVTFDRAQAPEATRTVTTAVIYMTAIYIPTGTVISNFNAISSTTSASGTHCWFALFNNSRVQLATTADDTSAAAFTADVTKTQAVATIASGASATFTTTYSGLHYVGLCAVFTGTAPAIRCENSGNSILNGLAPILTGTSNATQTTPNAFAFTANALTATSNRDYIWLT